MKKMIKMMVFTVAGFAFLSANLSHSAVNTKEVSRAKVICGPIAGSYDTQVSNVAGKQIHGITANTDNGWRRCYVLFYNCSSDSSNATLKHYATLGDTQEGSPSFSFSYAPLSGTVGLIKNSTAKINNVVTSAIKSGTGLKSTIGSGDYNSINKTETSDPAGVVRDVLNSPCDN